MYYQKDINRLVKEKNRLRRMKEKIGGDILQSPAREVAGEAKAKIDIAVKALHEAEIILRNY